MNAPSIETPRPQAVVESRPDLVTLRRLQQVRGFPAVSVLLPTSPSNGLTGHDAAALDELVDQAAARLDAETGSMAAQLGHRLRSLADRARTTPADRAIGLYVHTEHSEIVRLPMPVRNRVVVAETFATGDLVMASRFAPHYLLLLLGIATARLFDGYGRWLEERNADEFRAVNPWRGASNLRAVGWDVDASVAHAARQRSYLRRVDAALDRVQPPSAAPLVLAGDPPLCAAFLDVTTHPERVAGTVRCDEARTGHDAIGRLAGRLITVHRSRLEQEALTAVDPAGGSGPVIGGIVDVWPAAIRGQGGTLLVEEFMTVPARITGDGMGIRPAAPEGGRGVVADVIGELAWAVTFYGGDVVVVPSGSLEPFDGIALIRRPPLSADSPMNDLRRSTPDGA
jgi:hypothetical protein